jgi:hypothetical protein
MSISTTTKVDVHLPHNYKARAYQGEALHALQRKKKPVKRAVWVWHRRAGKDKTAMAGHLIPKMFERVGAYYHWFPTGALGRKIIWDGMDKTGLKFIDHFPADRIAKKNDNEMKITLKNGSVYQIVGTDRIETVGPNPIGNIFSEYSLQNPKAWEYVRPILAENNGWAIFCYTPRGKNHGYKLYKMALNNPKWYCKVLTVNDTKAISKESIQDERDAGMTEDLIEQEFYCSWELGAEGAFYARAMGDALKQGRISIVPHDPHATVDTIWDLGIGGNAIWFVQWIRLEVHLIDYYEWYGQELSHYATQVDEKAKANGYKYGTHYAPPDVNKRELGTGSTTFEIANQLGLNFEVLPQEENIYDGINRVLSMLLYCWFDSEKCMQGIDAVEGYHKEYNEKYKVYADKPCHDWASHGADGLRYVSMVWKRGAGAGLTKERIRQMREKHRRP